MSDQTPVTDGEAPKPPGPPTDPIFSVLGVEPLPLSVTPGLRFHMHVTEPNGRDIYMISLAAQIHIDPARRQYDAATRDRLFGMFGAAERWGATTQSFHWQRIEMMVANFVGSTAFTLDVPCTYDLEITASNYFNSLPDGHVPLTFFFNGTVLYAGENDRLQVVLVPWSSQASFKMPISAWRETIDTHFPKGGYVHLHDDTMDLLKRHKTAVGAHTYDEAVLEMLRREEETGTLAAAETDSGKIKVVEEPAAPTIGAADGLSRLGDELAKLRDDSSKPKEQ